MMSLNCWRTAHLQQIEMIVDPGYEEVGAKFLKGQM